MFHYRSLASILLICSGLAYANASLSDAQLATTMLSPSDAQRHLVSLNQSDVQPHAGIEILSAMHARGNCDLIGNPANYDYVVSLTTWPGLVPDRIVYVDANAPLGGDGSTWATAYQSLHDALNAEDFDTQLVDIRIARGLYRADRVNGNNTLDPDLTFELPGITMDNDVPTGLMRIAGGFAGRDAEDPDQRNPDQFPTVFTGDLLTNDNPDTFSNYEDNTRVMFEPGITELNGITIEHGRIAANEVRWLTDSTIRYCFASGDDLPLLRMDRSPVFARSARIVGNIFHNNRAEQFGGAMTARGAVVVANNLFLQNQAPIGGAIGISFFASADLFVQNSYFAANRADSETGGFAGAVFNSDSNFDEGSTQFAHCVFVGNEAIDGIAGGPTTQTARQVIYNSIFDQNYSSIGSGLDAATSALFSSGQISTTTVRRNVFRKYNPNAETSPKHPRIQLNLEANPGFHDLLGPDGLLGTLDDDPSLGDGSPSIEWSTSIEDLPEDFADLVLFDLADLDGDCEVLEPLPIDLVGNPRSLGDGADAGCVEYVPDSPPSPITDWNYIDPRITDFSTEAIRLYVDANGSGDDGLSWESAFTNPSDALHIAASRLGPVEIWVAAGEYLPQITRSNIESFRLSENVVMLGGFVGDEASADQRDPDTNKTVLTGDFLANDDPQDPFSFIDNARQLVISIGPRGGGVLDGFTITAASPKRRLIGGVVAFNDQLSTENAAGLLYIGSGNVELRNCELGPYVLRNPAAEGFVNNPLIALEGTNSNLLLIDCAVNQDFTAGEQSVPSVQIDRSPRGVQPRQGSGNLSLLSSRIDLTQPSTGNAFVNSPILLSDAAGEILIHGSTAKTNRGLRIVALDSRKLTVENSTALDPAAIVIAIRDTNTSLLNSTFGSELFRFFRLSSDPVIEIHNTVFDANILSPAALLTDAAATYNVFNNDFDFADVPFLDSSNIKFDFENNAAAFFVDPLGPDGIPYTGDEDLRLAPGSPAINTGSNALVTSEFDLDGNPRIIGSVVDRGAYEFTGTCTGDVNGDGVIDLADLNRVLANYGQDTPFGDANGDGSVTMTDLNIVLAAFGNTCPQP